MPKRYPDRHANDVFNAPLWVFVPGVSLGSVKAARMLGMSRVRLLNCSDSLGLTVFRDVSERRHYLITQLKKVKDQLGNVTVEDVRSKMKGKSDALLEKTTERRT